MSVDSAGAIAGCNCGICQEIREAQPKPVAVLEAVVSDDMIQAACVAGYGVDADKDSNLYNLMKRALTAALAA
jgi:hypothetical protein